MSGQVKNINVLKVVDLNEVIGHGAYGVVKSVLVHGTVCAAKEIHSILLQNVSLEEYAALKEAFLRECVNCSKLIHPNIVQFQGIYYPSESTELPWLIMEKLEYSLTNFVEKHKDNEILFSVKVSIFNDILLGLQYLHAQNIVHRDLSSNNILLTKFLVAKIADLGMAKLINPNMVAMQSIQPGMPMFMPPEALAWGYYDSSIDVFSFGCIMIHLMSQRFPDPEGRINKITGKECTGIERREKYLAMIQKPLQLKRFILQCIDDAPKNRPTTNDLLKYFDQFIRLHKESGICLVMEHRNTLLKVICSN